MNNEMNNLESGARLLAVNYQLIGIELMIAQEIVRLFGCEAEKFFNDQLELDRISSEQ